MNRFAARAEAGFLFAVAVVAVALVFSLMVEGSP